MTLTTRNLPLLFAGGLALAVTVAASTLARPMPLLDDEPSAPRAEDDRHHGHGDGHAHDTDAGDHHGSHDHDDDADGHHGDDDRDSDHARDGDDELKAMKDELQRLTTEYQLMQQRQKNEMIEAELRKQRLSTEQSLAKVELDEQLAALKFEVSRLEAEAKLRSANLKKELAEASSIIEARTTETKLRKLDAEEEMLELRHQAQKLVTQNQILQEKVKHVQMENQLARREFDEQLVVMKGKLEVQAKRDEVENRVFVPLEYSDDPFHDGVLNVSDRRIALNGPIMSGTADFVCDRIDFYNNQSDDPIFIVIDSSPGGSVMEGYRIVKGIDSSPAPVHVVVKSFAASMAAVITTLAPHSYAYPNAIILHHQMSSGMRGNLTQQAESLETSMEWARRLADPVAKKMGISYEELVEQMYEHNSDGDWEEFADRAVALKWVDHVVEEIRESGMRRRPKGGQFSLPFFMEHMQRDDKGRPYVMLPPLQPFDHYMIYDPDQFYRW